MRKIKKVVALAISAVVSTGLFAGCSADELSLYNAFNKAQKITSMEAQTELTLRVTAKNMSPDEEATMEQVLPLLNGAKLSMQSKISGNKDNTAGKLESKINFKNASVSLDTGIWVDTDMSGDKMKVKEVFEIPSLISSSLPPEYSGKKYLVLDLDDMEEIPGMPKQDLSKTIEFTAEFQKKFNEFMDKYIEQYDPKLNLVNKVGTENIVQPTGTQAATIYEVNLNDKAFKDLIRYSINNFAENKDAIEFIKYYIESALVISGAPEAEIKSIKEELDKGFAEFEANIPTYLEQVNKGLDSIADLKILGDNGIKARYAINADGYIINESGTAEFVIDLPAIAKLAGETEAVGNPTGVYTIALEFKNDIYNINKDIEIKFPVVNANNSINYVDLIKSSIPSEEDYAYNNAKALVEKAKVTKVFADYNNAYAAILEVPKDKQGELLSELAVLWDEVYTEDIAMILGEMGKFAEEKDIAKFYELFDSIEKEVKVEANKQYLFGELHSWGRNAVFTPDVVAATDAIIAAGEKKDQASIDAAAAAIEKVKNPKSNKWLTEQLDAVKASIK